MNIRLSKSDLITIVGFVSLMALISAVFLWPTEQRQAHSACINKVEHQWIHGRCIDLKCKDKNTCGDITCPACECRNLVVGQPINSIYALLGQPRRVENDRLVWITGKGESKEIFVTIKNNQLEAKFCNP
jgi:hypothetical protein